MDADTNHTGAGEFAFKVSPGPEGQPVAASNLYRSSHLVRTL